MEHGHNHSHSHELKNISQIFIVGILLNAFFVIVEFVTGFWYQSLALMSDAGHNLSDVASLIMALLALQLSKIKPNTKYTYGYRKTTILVSLLNAILLFATIGGIAWQSILRLAHPPEVQGLPMAMVASVGIVINTVTAFLFFKDREKDLNIGGAFWHLAADALVSLGVVVGGIMIYYTQWYWVDIVISLVIIIFIFLSTTGLLTESLKLVMDGVPQGIDIERVKNEILKNKLICKVEHLHVWAISTTQNALTAHLMVEKNFDWQLYPGLKNEIKHQLEHLNIQHATLELELTEEDIEKNCC